MTSKRLPTLRAWTATALLLLVAAPGADAEPIQIPPDFLVGEGPLPCVTVDPTRPTRPPEIIEECWGVD